MKKLRSLGVGLLLFLSTACADDAAIPSSEAASPSGEHAGEGGAGPGALEDGWCARLAGAPAGSAEDPSEASPGELAAVHAGVRYFGFEASNLQVDSALTAALSEQGLSDGEAAAIHYAAALESVCAVSRAGQVLPEASVELVDEVAYLRPGSGNVTLPAGTKAVLLDLRALPNAIGLGEALNAAASLVLQRPLEESAVRAHRRSGLTNEAFGNGAHLAGYYPATVVEQPLPPLVGAASQAYPLAVLVGSRLAPRSAELALRLRLANRAWLLGEAIEVAVAESFYLGVGMTNIAFRVRDMSHRGRRLPDIVPADLPDGTAPEAWRTELPAEIAWGPAERSAPVATDEYGKVQLTEISPAQLGAALLSMQGAAQLFFPYLHEIESIDTARLQETLKLAETVSERAEARDVLRRFGAAYPDGHGWLVDAVPPAGGGAGLLPIMLDLVDGWPVVTRSFTGQLQAGDTIVEIDGMDAPAWFQREMARSYGATEGFRFVNAVQELIGRASGKTLVVKAPDGSERRETVVGMPHRAEMDLFSGSRRKHGWLSELGADSLYYLNLDGRYVGGASAVDDALTAAQGASGLVLDMRGHPASGGAPYDPTILLRRLIPDTFSMPSYRVPVWIGLEPAEPDHPYLQSFNPRSDLAFSGPVVLIVDHQAVSYAEDFSMMLVTAGRVTVVGRPSAGTTGSVTGMQLPGGFSWFMTGMEARYSDGGLHFGRGIVPDVMVSPTVDDYAGGRDAFVDAAIEALSAAQ